MSLFELVGVLFTVVAVLGYLNHRYIGLPAQALSYYVGYQELLRLRAEAERRATAAGDIFDIRGFHGAVLDAGSVPLPALGTAVAAWLDRRTE